MAMQALIDAILAVAQEVRYVAVYAAGQVHSRERGGLVAASASESDRYEELIVNPTLLTLLQQRGAIDCGGLRFVLIRYGSFFQFVQPLRDGHLSVAIESSADVVAIARAIQSLPQVQEVLS